MHLEADPSTFDYSLDDMSGQEAIKGTRQEVEERGGFQEKHCNCIQGKSENTTLQLKTMIAILPLAENNK